MQPRQPGCESQGWVRSPALRLGQTDAGIAHLVERGVADPERYRCVVSIAGVTDLDDLADDMKHYTVKRSAREQVELITYDGTEHSLDRNAVRIDMLTRSGHFLEAHLAAKPTPSKDSGKASKP